MRSSLPKAFDQLLDTMRRLEEHYRDMQDIEFTVEDEQLYLLQTRSAKRTAAAALKAAVTMVDEGLIAREDAVGRIDPAQLDQLLHPMIDPKASLDVAAKGLNASPGAASGAIVFDADTAVERAKTGPVILVRWETTPDDIHGMIAAQGILTVHGGMTSHAAVVARGMGKPCVAGCDDLTLGDGGARIGEHSLQEGDVITIDGGTGASSSARCRSSRRRSTRTSRRFSSGRTSSGGCACARTPTTRRTRRAHASSAPRESASAGPSTCSSATGCPSCRR